MNTTTQRPTPETDAEVKRIQADQSIFVCEEFNVLSDFARKLERERDVAQERAESKHGLWMAELSRVTGLEKQLEAMRKERDEVKEELENWKASGIHSCHDECKRPLCVANRKIKAMREAIKNIYYLTEGYADGAPDASAHDKLCNEVASICRINLQHILATFPLELIQKP